MCTIKPVVLVTSLTAIASFCGCGQNPTRDAAVSGTVVVDGQLAERGTVTFHPVDSGPVAVGRIMLDGSYAARTGKGDLRDVDRGTVKAGKYKVTIVVLGDPTEPLLAGGPPGPGPRLSAAKYASVNTTDLERTVKPGDNLFIFEIEGASAESATDDGTDATTEPEASEPDSTETEALDEQATAETAPAEESSSEAASDNSAEPVDDQADISAEQPADVASQPDAPADDAAEEPQQ